MDQNNQADKPKDSQPTNLADSQTPAEETGVDLNNHPPKQPPAAFRGTPEPLSELDQKLMANWKESLPQIIEPETVEVKTEEIKLDQTTAPNVQELRTTPPPPPETGEPPLVASSIFEPAAENQIGITPPTTPYVSPAQGLPPSPPPVARPTFFKPIYLAVVALILIIGAIFAATFAGFLDFGKLPKFNLSFLNRSEKANTLSTPQPTKTPPSPSATPAAQLLHRNISWFVPVPPSTTPADVATNWQSFTTGELSFKYPKDWQLIDSTSLLAGIEVISSKFFIPPPDDPLKTSPIEITIVKSPTEINTLIANFTADQNKQIIKTTLAVNNFQAVKTNNEIDPAGVPVERLFITVNGQVVVLTLRAQLPEDQVIFDVVASSITVG